MLNEQEIRRNKKYNIIIAIDVFGGDRTMNPSSGHPLKQFKVGTTGWLFFISYRLRLGVFDIKIVNSSLSTNQNKNQMVTR